MLPRMLMKLVSDQFESNEVGEGGQWRRPIPLAFILRVVGNAVDAPPKDEGFLEDIQAL